MAQLVARDFWEVEVAGSSPVTQTTFYVQGVAQLVARSVRDAEVVGSSPITLTIFIFDKNGKNAIILIRRTARLFWSFLS